MQGARGGRGFRKFLYIDSQLPVSFNSLEERYYSSNLGRKEARSVRFILMRKFFFPDVHYSATMSSVVDHIVNKVGTRFFHGICGIPEPGKQLIGHHMFRFLNIDIGNYDQTGMCLYMLVISPFSIARKCYGIAWQWWFVDIGTTPRDQSRPAPNCTVAD